MLTISLVTAATMLAAPGAVIRINSSVQAEPRTVHVGETITDSLTATDGRHVDGRRMKAQQIRLQRGARVQVLAQSVGFDPALIVSLADSVDWFQVLNDDGAQQIDPGVGAHDAGIDFIAPVAGLYRILVVAEGAEGSGRFTLDVRAGAGQALVGAPSGLAQVAAAAALGETRGAPLSLDAATRDSLSPIDTVGARRGRPVRRHQVVLRAGDSISVRVAAEAFVPTLAIWNTTPEAELLLHATTRSGDSSRLVSLTFTAPANGIYTLFVGGQRGTWGAYDVILHRGTGLPIATQQLHRSGNSWVTATLGVPVRA